MPRLRLAQIEVKVCPTPDCFDGSAEQRPRKYDGELCPGCGEPFRAATTFKEDRSCLILVDTDPPIYETAKRCRCPECANLYDLNAEEVSARFRCANHECGELLFPQAAARRGWLGNLNFLQQVRELDQRRRKLGCCPKCGEAIAIGPWCPLCATRTPPPAGNCLPNSQTVVWVRA